MKITQIKIKNFKSFGNNENILKLNDNGELILLTGQNGAGKSSLLNTMEYAFYGKVKGKKSKTVTLGSLPNRFNKNLRTEVDFESYGKEINIVRSINPSNLILNVKGEEPYDKAGKSLKQAKIEELVGIDFDTFKSFISMSINDFKNFMTLSPEEKRVLLDRLFNLEMINDITKILKEKKKQHKHQIDLFETEIRTYDESLNEFNSSIKKLKEVTKKNTEAEKLELKELFNSKKDIFKKYKETLEKCDVKEIEISNSISTNQKALSETTYKINDLVGKIKLYDSGKCPTCATTLTDETHKAYRTEMKNTLDELKELHLEFKKEQEELAGKNKKLKDFRRKNETSFSELKYFLNDLKQKQAKLEQEDEQEEESVSVNELLNSISNIENRKKASADNLNLVSDDEMILNELTKLFSNDGIKKSIIAKIVKPINHFIKENLFDLDMDFNIELDDDFSAKITVLGEEIDTETLSTGETKKANICVMLAYLKLIRMKKHINVLFLDEVFASIDIEGIYSILQMLRKFANEYNINIFLVHHAMLDKTYFDKVLRIEKNITSNIIEE